MTHVTRPAAALILASLLVALGVGIAPNVSSQLVAVGERLWPGYAAELRADPEPPTCDADALAAELAACPADAPAPAPAPADPFGGQDPFAAPAPADPFGGQDPFAAPAPAPAPAPADPFGGADPFAAPAPADPFAGQDPFAAPAPAGPNCPALRSLHAECVAAHEAHDASMARLTGGVRAFRAVDRSIGDVAKFAYWKHLLSLLVLVGGLAATANRMHIALRSAETLLEDRVAQGAQLVAHLLLAASCFADWRVQMASTAERVDPEVPLLWAFGFLALGVANVAHLARPPAFDRQGTSGVRLAMVVPLYAYMALIAGAYFLLAEAHPSGQAIYLHKFAQVPNVYVGIGLYLWAGMLLAETFMPHRVFGLVRPWRLPPPWLAWLVGVVGAVPTAYSGASGIFVLATGAVVFHALREAGANQRLALAATAMSGSLGVVLRPCLVVVLIAVMNKQVTTDALFAEGLKVFGLTAAIYLVVMLAYGRGSWRVAPVGEALPATLRALGPLVPYLAIGGGVVAFYAFVLGTPLNERSAPFVLPMLMLPIVAWDRLRPPLDEAEVAHAATHGGRGLGGALLQATHESAHHVGALLMLMAGSVGIGGVVERAELMSLVPEQIGSPLLTMALLVVILVIVGMTMDPMGAVVLVTVTVAQVAYANGIDPVHFWMTVLVAFELGYLSPPVALNQLLARQVVGHELTIDHDDTVGFWARYEHQWLPVLVMGLALLIVAFAPLAWYPLGG